MYVRTPACRQGGLGEAAATAVAAVQQRHSLGAARAFYRRLLALPPAGGRLFHALLGLELEAPAAERLRAKELRTLFEVRGSGACCWQKRQAAAQERLSTPVGLDGACC